MSVFKINFMNIAIFAAGCFWGIEKKFDLTKGITKVEVGYTGGETKNPTYEQVCYEETGHAEAVRINFDENIITYKELLNVFWSSPVFLSKENLLQPWVSIKLSMVASRLGLFKSK